MKSLAWSTRDLILAAAIAAVFGVFFRTFGYVHSLYSEALGKAFGEWDYGIWFMAGLLGAVLLQRPGAALMTEVLAGAISVLLGSKYGWDVINSAVLQGLACEIVFALGLWRHFGWGMMIFAGGVAGVVAFVHDYYVYNYLHYPPILKVWLLGVMTLSGGLLGGMGARMIGLALARSGAIDQTALGREVLRRGKETQA